MYLHINGNERDFIAVQKSQGISIRSIAKKLGRSPASVSREIRRNRLSSIAGYSAITAQIKTEERIAISRRRHPLKNQDVYSYILERLRWGWSPEQISGRLRQIEHPGDSHWTVCHETIYRFIYGKENQERKLWGVPAQKTERQTGTEREKYSESTYTTESFHP